MDAAAIADQIANVGEWMGGVQGHRAQPTALRSQGLADNPVVDVDVTHHRGTVTDRHRLRARGEEAASSRGAYGREPDHAIEQRQRAEQSASRPRPLVPAGRAQRELLDCVTHRGPLPLKIVGNPGDSAPGPDALCHLDDVHDVLNYRGAPSDLPLDDRLPAIVSARAIDL